MRSIILVAAALVAVGAAAPAQAAVPGSAPAADAVWPAPVAPGDVAELEAYTAWLIELERRNAPGLEAVGALRQVWEQALASGAGMRGAAAVRPAQMRAIAALDAANADLAAVETPDFTRLRLPDDLRPAAMVALMRRTIGELRTVAQTFLPVLDAMERGERRAAGAALDRLMETLQILLRSQEAMVRARLAAMPRAESHWELHNFRLLLLNASVRVTSTWPAMRAGRPDPAFAQDLVGLADRIEVNAAQGAAKIEAELARASAELREDEAAGDAAGASLSRRLIAGLTANRQVAAPARALAASLRAHATRLRGPVDLDSFRSLNRAIRDAGAEVDRIASASLHAMAAD